MWARKLCSLETFNKLRSRAQFIKGAKAELLAQPTRDDAMRVRSSTSATPHTNDHLSAGVFDLEKALQPPHLEHALPDHHAQLEDAPPLHTPVGALGRVAVSALAHHNVGLFVFDLREKVGKLAHYPREQGGLASITTVLGYGEG
nr:hypothetical protein CFP56_79501 [Quercus suber]